MPKIKLADPFPHKRGIQTFFIGHQNRQYNSNAASTPKSSIAQVSRRPAYHHIMPYLPHHFIAPLSRQQTESPADHHYAVWALCIHGLIAN